MLDGLQAHRVQDLDAGLHGQHLVHVEHVVHGLVPVGANRAVGVAGGFVEAHALGGDDLLPIRPGSPVFAAHQPPELPPTLDDPKPPRVIVEPDFVLAVVRLGWVRVPPVAGVPTPPLAPP